MNFIEAQSAGLCALLPWVPSLGEGKASCVDLDCRMSARPREIRVSKVLTQRIIEILYYVLWTV